MNDPADYIDTIAPDDRGGWEPGDDVPMATAHEMATARANDPSASSLRARDYHDPVESCTHDYHTIAGRCRECGEVDDIGAFPIYGKRFKDGTCKLTIVVPGRFTTSITDTSFTEAARQLDAIVRRALVER